MLDRSRVLVWKLRSLVWVTGQSIFLTGFLFILISWGSRNWFGIYAGGNFLKSVIGSTVCLYVCTGVKSKLDR